MNLSNPDPIRSGELMLGCTARACPEEVIDVTARGDQPGLVRVRARVRANQPLP